MDNSSIITAMDKLRAESNLAESNKTLSDLKVRINNLEASIGYASTRIVQTCAIGAVMIVGIAATLIAYYNSDSAE